MPKTCFVDQLTQGLRVINSIFFVSGWMPSKTKAGKDYIRLKLMDRSGEIEAVCWEVTPEQLKNRLEREYAVVTGTAGLYQDKIQLTVDSFSLCSEELDLQDYMPAACIDRECMEQTLDELIRSVKRPHFKKLLEVLLCNPARRMLFINAPAGKSMHHAYSGGLLEHTVSVAQNCDVLSRHYPKLDRDLLIAGALLHDVGKIDEMRWNGPMVEYTDEGNLVGHLFIGAAMVREAAAHIEGFDELSVQLLSHIILSHHGEFAYGSPVLPKCMEAMMLHYCDNIDAKMFQFADAASADDHAGRGNFTNWIRTLDRPIFCGKLPDQQTE